MADDPPDLPLVTMYIVSFYQPTFIHGDLYLLIYITNSQLLQKQRQKRVIKADIKFEADINTSSNQSNVWTVNINIYFDKPEVLVLTALNVLNMLNTFYFYQS